MGHRVSLFVISLYLCTQHLFTEVEMNDRGYFSTTRKEMIITYDRHKTVLTISFGILGGL